MANLNAIGTFYFRNFFGSPPELPSQMLQTLDYPGIDWHAWRMIGQRSPVWEIESIVDVPNGGTGRALFAGYKATIGNGSYQMVWNNLDLDADGYRVVVLNVAILQLVARIAICGGLNPPSLIDLHCKWQLMLTPYP